uniref:LPXTG-motif cell wall anchor domain protein n=1 Tax=Erysipelothrix tonsillarum TaxID=38402 RepID=A0A6S6I5F9_9FIRM|nr:LPXTG-motif cell wall anchor domain protein [Erysipelothrix tonsillarum]
MKKKLMIVLSSFLLILSIIPLSANFEAFNLESHAYMTYDSFNSGEKNSIEFKLKATGAHTTFTNLKVEVLMPEFVQMDITSIKNALGPDYTVVRNNQGLSITKAVFESGTYLELPLIFTVPNGVTPTKAALLFQLSVTTDQLTKPVQVLDTIISASSPLKVSKAYDGLKDPKYNGSLGLSPGMDSVWITKAQIDRQDQGQLYIKEASKIMITETYNELLVYQGMLEGPEPNVVDPSQRKLIWYFEAPSYAVQDQSEQALFKKHLKVNYQAKPGSLDAVIPGVGVETAMSFTNVDDVTITDSDYAETSLYPSETETPEVYGSWYVPGHFSPIDAFGNYSTDFDALNKRPTVYPWATLTYAHQMTALEHGENERYVEYKWNYYINQHLKLESFKAPGRFDYRPNREHGDATPLYEQPILNAHVYDDQQNLIAVFKHVEHDQIITRSEILAQQQLPDSTQIHQIQYDFEKTVPGMMIDDPLPQKHNGLSRMATYTFSIHDTWREDAHDGVTALKNEMDIETAYAYGSSTSLVRELYDFKEDTENDYHISFPDGRKEAWYEGFYVLSAPRWANVVETEAAYHPTVTNTIALMDQYKGQVYQGPNKLNVEIVNEPSSVGAIRDNVHSIIYLPKSIQFTDLSVHGSLKSIQKVEADQANYDIYHLVWNLTQLAPYESISHQFDVDVAGTLQDLNLKLYTILENNETYETLQVDNPTIQDTLIIKHDIDTTRTPFSSTQMLQSLNHYQMISDYQLKIKKWVKGAKDPVYHSEARIDVEDTIDYKLSLSNQTGRAIDSFVLMDLLPSVDDRGITDFTPRNSEFNVTLSGPIQVDTEMFDVYYSTSKKPSREDLNHNLTTEGFGPIVDHDVEAPNWVNADDVKDWSSISSFKITLKAGKQIAILKDFEFIFHAQITEPEQVKEQLKTIPQMTAWNSFAVAINGNPTIEPLKVAVHTGIITPDDIPEKPIENEPNEKPGEGDKTISNKPESLPQTGVSPLKYPYILVMIGIVFTWDSWKKRKN